ncbi:MAG: phosphatidate cytidylyltransferase [Alistipes sp.]|nr:phosphatidate cytidylyltransferase [Alistipes sp.]
MNDKLKNLIVRTISGIGLLVVVFGSILWSDWSLLVLLALMIVGGMVEFYGLAEKRGLAPQRVLGLVTGLLLLVLNFALVSTHIEVFGEAMRPFGVGLAMLLLLFPLMFICELYRKHENPLANIAVTITSVFYVALPLSMLLYVPIIGREVWNGWALIGYVALVWSNDVFAYLSGMAFGRHRLFERLSPKKSWEGFFGGLVGAVVAAAVVARLMGDNLYVWCGLAVVVVITAVLGDLVESMFKRAADVKDSGNLIPGHGGVLDRFDAMLVSAPFAVVYLLFVC